MAVRRTYADYLPDDGRQPDLADQIANSSFEDPVPAVWISPADAGEPDSGWVASWQFEDDHEEFSGTVDKVVAWARRRPAAARHIQRGARYVALDPWPDDEPALPAAGPRVRIMGPDHDGRWVALWSHRGQQQQFWGGRDEVVRWARAQPAERRLIVSEDGWLPLPS